MQKMVKVFFTRVPYGGDRESAEIVYSEYLQHEEYEAKKAELKASFVAVKTDETPYLSHITILKNKEVVLHKVRPMNSNPKRCYRALERLCIYLNSSFPDDVFSFKNTLEAEPQGFSYHYCLSYGDRFENDFEKQQFINRKIVGRKSAITKVINKAKQIREKSKQGLFCDSYKDDKKYIIIINGLVRKQKRLWDARKITPSMLPSLAHEADELFY